MSNQEVRRRWGRGYDYYLRKVMPQDREVKIIDLGCGGGNLLYYLGQKGYENIAGIDISEEQVQRAREVGAEVIQGDVLEFLRGREGQYDLLVALDLIEHFKKDEAVGFLEGCYRAAKEGGRVIVQTVNAESPCSSAVRYGDFTHEVIYTPRVLKELLERSGFKEISYWEAGPVACGAVSLGRWLGWRVIRGMLKAWNLVEMGHGGSGVLTRTFFISGVKS